MTATFIQCPMCADFDANATCPQCSVISDAVRKEWDEVVTYAKGSTGTYVHVPLHVVLAINQVIVNAVAAQAVPAVDPLQGAASWLASALVDCKAADIQQRLAIGYNRADRLLRAAKGDAS
jgi:hypothetical protein